MEIYSISAEQDKPHSQDTERSSQETRCSPQYVCFLLQAEDIELKYTFQ